MKKSWFGYGLLAFYAAVFAWVWSATGDLVGSILLLVVLLLFGALLLAISGYLVSNTPALSRRLRGVSREQQLEDLEAGGAAVREDYKATGALSVEELNTSSIMHFVDIGGGKVLCLIGQQYYDFEPIADDPEVNQPRRFPTAEFSLLRDSVSNEVLALYPGSKVIEPIVCAPVVWPQQLYDLGFRLRDGEIVSGTNLEDVERVIRDAAK